LYRPLQQADGGVLIVLREASYHDLREVVNGNRFHMARRFVKLLVIGYQLSAERCCCRKSGGCKVL